MKIQSYYSLNGQCKSTTPMQLECIILPSVGLMESVKCLVWCLSPVT